MGDDIKLRVSKIEKSFPGVKALDKIDFTVRKGTVHALCGENGAGKSTLMKIINGIYKPDAGEIFVDEKSVKIKDPIMARSLGIAMIAQELNYVPEMSVEENIFLGRLPVDGMGRVKWREVREKTERLLKEEHLPYKATDKLKTLTTSDIQMLEILKAISNDASIVVMDEPTSSITQKEVELLFKKIALLKAKGCAIVYISHKMDEVFRIADDITVFRDGTVVKSMRAEDTNIDEVIALMVGRRMENVYPKENIEIGEPLLEVKDLKSGQLFEDVTFHVGKGEIVGFAGLVGAGRTEIMRAVFGADPIDSGKIKIKGKEVHIKSPRQAIKHGIAFLTEDRKGQGLVLAPTIRTNLILANMKGFSSGLFLNEKKILETGEQNIASLRIKTPSIDEIVGQLSGGNQQKVVIGKWVNTDAEIFIFDEPTRGIDVGAKVEVYNVMNSLVKQGKCVIMVSSEMPEILGMSDRVIVMRGGEVMAEVDRDSEHFNQEDLMKAAWGGKLDD